MRFLDRKGPRHCLAGLLLFAVAAIADAQVGTFRRGQETSSPKRRPKFTEISVELLAGREGVGLHAQQWQQTFQKLGVPLRVRRAILDDKPEVRERTFGTMRQVTVIGRLDPSGRIILPDRIFRRSDAAKLAEWLRELKTYGAQGAPQGKPLWGLNKSQFEDLYNSLSEKVETELEGLELEAALAKMQLPAKYPIRFTTATRSWIPEPVPKVRQPLKGFTKGTALAILLGDYGLGYRPLRTPEGAIELAVDPLSKVSDVWPIGWDLKLSRSKTAPKLFELVPVELEDLKLLDVLHAVSAKTEVPILVDHYRIEARHIDIENLRVSHRLRQTTWSLLIKRLTSPAKLARRLKIDERGQPFVWVTTLRPRRRQQ